MVVFSTHFLPDKSVDITYQKKFSCTLQWFCNTDFCARCDNTVDGLRSQANKNANTTPGQQKLRPGVVTFYQQNVFTDRPLDHLNGKRLIPDFRLAFTNNQVNNVLAVDHAGVNASALQGFLIQYGQVNQFDTNTADSTALGRGRSRTSSAPS